MRPFPFVGPLFPLNPKPRRITAEEIRAIGPLLYGVRWIAELARTLGASPTTVKQWRDGIRFAHHSRTVPIIALLRERRDAIDAALKALE